ncbi:MAG: hypothetical protein GY858_08895 [Candidatus Omnitrophica bacterium]|nr:hypothetical protein [Candidatus Omnitrophota bacterium]
MKVKVFLLSSWKRIWRSFLDQIGIWLCSALFIAVYLGLKQFKIIRDFIGGIPIERAVTLLVFIFVIVVILFIKYRKQKKYIVDLERASLDKNKDTRMVTHCGVWWKIYLSSEYIEDFPYCTCCPTSPKKLKQTEWHPDEIYQCPETKNDFKLFDGIPRERKKILDGLYETYFNSLGHRVENEFCAERNRLIELNRDIPKNELFDKLFSLLPLNKIPRDKLEEIRKKYPNPESAFHFVDRHFSRYKQYFKYDIEGKED